MPECTCPPRDTDPVDPPVAELWKPDPDCLVHFPPKCVHLQRNPENAQWPDGEALDHFLHCLSEDRQATTWHYLRTAAATGDQCLAGDHQGMIADQIAYTRKLLAGLRKALEQAAGPAQPEHRLSELRTAVQEWIFVTHLRAMFELADADALRNPYAEWSGAWW